MAGLIQCYKEMRPRRKPCEPRKLIDYAYMIDCIDIGGSFIKHGFMAAEGTVRLIGQWATPTQSWDDFVALLRRLLNTQGTTTQPVALSVAGTIDPDDGRCTSANVPCLQDRSLSAELTTLLNRPVLAANDADCFALAEASSGAGVGHRVV